MIGLLSPLILYLLPLMYAQVFSANPIHSDENRIQWSQGGLEPDVCIVVALFALAGLTLPTTWHRRSLARLYDRNTIMSPSGDLERRGDAVELMARSLVLRYAVRLAGALAISLPIFFIALDEATPIIFWGLGFSGRVIPTSYEYVPLVAVLTIVIVAHVPTRRRVFGSFAQMARPTPPGENGN